MENCHCRVIALDEESQTGHGTGCRRSLAEELDCLTDGNLAAAAGKLTDSRYDAGEEAIDCQYCSHAEQRRSEGECDPGSQFQRSRFGAQMLFFS